MRLEGPHNIFLTVEVDLEDYKIFEVLFLGQAAEDGLLRLTGGAPRCGNVDENGPYPAFCAASKAARVNRLRPAATAGSPAVQAAAAITMTKERRVSISISFLTDGIAWRSTERAWPKQMSLSWCNPDLSLEPDPSTTTSLPRRDAAIDGKPLREFAHAALERDDADQRRSSGGSMERATMPSPSKSAIAESSFPWRSLTAVSVALLTAATSTCSSMSARRQTSPSWTR